MVMLSGSLAPTERALHSWKEIANYTGRGVRTIQRYELKLGFPIRRPAGTPRSAVLAFPHEIDQWLAKSPTKLEGPSAEPIVPKRVTRGGQVTAHLLYSKAIAQAERAEAIAQRLRETQELVVRMTTFVTTTRAARKTVSAAREELHTRVAAIQDDLSQVHPGGGENS